MTSTSRGYQRVDSSDVGSLVMEEDGDNPHEALLHRNNDDYASTYHHVGVEYDSYEEMERQELDDRVAEIPEGFHRRQRRVYEDLLFGIEVAEEEEIRVLGRKLRTREALFGEEVTRAGLGRAEYYEDSHMIHSCDKSGHEDIDDESDDETKDEDEEEEETGIRKFAKLVLPHVALVLLTCTYTVIGALIFYSVEQPHEQMMKEQQLKLIYTRQNEFVDDLIRLAAGNETKRYEWETLAERHMHNMSDQLFVAFEKYFLTSNEVKKNAATETWTFSSSIFFAVTVVTTIGYGNPVPVTNIGRIWCILFSLLGIPLTLVTIADLGKFLSEHLVWLYGNYLKLKYLILSRHRKERREHVCEHCHSHGMGHDMNIEEKRIPAFLVLAILIVYTAFGGVLMSKLEPWSFFTSFYWSFITMTTVGFGDLMPRRDGYMYIILLYIILGLAITTMCIDLVGVQYIRKIHYFGRKIQDARSALAVVGGKVVLVSELYANLMQKRARNMSREAFIVENLYVSKHIIPFIPTDIRCIRYIDQTADAATVSTSSSAMDMQSCRFCHSRYSLNRAFK
ncbi:Protein CBR-TWK-7 [Caenorhabditis briggsae]|uniref:Protein CBR-TWK-7 n=1 Tax=Caenorhabditis briggsae TaxID=6238 RepID=A8Y3N2_CAEBR|nr:Protein CBR-TWK-7 [Caenorhabditis briggsae]CAP39501.2 Protein CBR-TWK-7 [Caenorhabditis briggsae]